MTLMATQLETDIHKIREVYSATLGEDEMKTFSLMFKVTDYDPEIRGDKAIYRRLVKARVFSDL